MNDLDYVELYAKKMRVDPSLFDQQKKLIEAQLQGSSSLFGNLKGPDFKENARKYLQGIGLL